ncbi:hypothetical protein U1Q18_051498, partial [Sarracenia purpurea var. burkii]
RGAAMPTRFGVDGPNMVVNGCEEEKKWQRWRDLERKRRMINDVGGEEEWRQGMVVAATTTGRKRR